ncbi:FAD-binding oxidoreductase [Fodinicurvata sp. EGI_FJ10296]|uniref:FAD-binding oxidoreductase n=1 Tax=Fodinicurvata sp. EGI_FJ10296 TaxID=3231908 RepID=UPI003452E045
MPEKNSATNPEFIASLQEIVGPKGIRTADDDLSVYHREWRGLYQGRARVIVRPASTDETARVVARCAAESVSMVPMGGNTGLVGAAVSAEDQVIISTERMTAIRSIDLNDNTITVESGCILQTLQETAAEHDRLFPLSLGAEGTCRIGGNLGTNAGGTGVLRYGNTRDLTLGIEAVLADGSVWNGLRRLRKDNTGYDLKHLFVGSEGTLGIITAAVLKLFPRPRQVETAFIAVPSPDAALDLFNRARAGSGEAVSAIEFMDDTGVSFACKHINGVTNPLSEPSPWYILLELSSTADDGTMRGRMELILEEAFEAAIVTDAALATNEAQARAFWHIRHGLVEAQLFEGGSIKHDVSVPISAVPAFLDQAMGAVTTLLPGIRPCPFGHLGDGNIHFNLSQPEGMDRQAFLDRWHEFSDRVHDIVSALGGSISAEHGIGILKRDENARRKDPTEYAMMVAVKRALDPHNLMNPGKLVSL